MTELSSEQWKSVEAIFASASALSQGEQDSHIEGSTDDEAVRSEVRSLLRVRACASGFLDEPASAGEVARDLRETRARGDEGAGGRLIGRYTVLRVLASGGMGTVYEARQDHPRRAVALKVIRPGVASPDLMRRFEQEAEVLGRLHHPGIAQIYEAGTFDLGAGRQPYFAMELICGVPLTQYADTNRQGTRQRVELMAKVCAAVQHAHLRGIIHRDLKPANILVDELGQPKVLDFGVARATDADLQTVTLRTDIGQLVGTVPYMSPEQATGRTEEVDARSDVYALGVVLYELLSGRLPYDIRDKMIHEAVRVIREEDPTPLSTVNPAFRGDVETILTKALEKDRSRRYQSAADLESDLERYLRDEPIAARPPSTMYQLGKFARRHRTLVAASAAILAVLVTGLVVTAVMAVQQAHLRDIADAQRREAERDRDRAFAAEQSAKQRRIEAERQTRIAQAVNTFLNEDVLAAVDPACAPDPDITMRAVLDLASQRIGGQFADDPLVEAAIRATLAGTYRNLGEMAEARRHVERAVEIRRAALGDDDPATLSSRSLLALILWSQGAFDEAERLEIEVLATQERILGARHADTLMTMNNLALVYWAKGRIADAVGLLERALEAYRVGWPENHPQTLTLLHNLGSYYADLNRYADAEAMLNESLQRRRAVLGDDHPGTIGTITSLAKLHVETGRHETARALASESLDRARRVLGPESAAAASAMGVLADVHQNLRDYAEAERLLIERLELVRGSDSARPGPLARARSDLGSLYIAMGRYADARPLLEEAMIGYRESLGDRHIFTLMVADQLAELYMNLDLIDEAEPIFRDVLTARTGMLGEDDPQTLTSMANVGWVLWRRNRLDEAEAYYRRVLEGRRRALPEGHPHTLRAMTQLGNLLQLQKKYDQAEPLVIDAYETQRALLGESHPDTLVALSILSLFYADQGRFDEAEPLARTALERARAGLPRGHWFTGVFLIRHGECLASLQRFDEAETQMLEGQRVLAAALGSGHARTTQAIRALISLYEMTGASEKSAQWRSALPVDPGDQADI